MQNGAGGMTEPGTPHENPVSLEKRKSRRLVVGGLVVLAIVVALIGLRLALPSLVKDYLNGQMADMGAYQGHIHDVDIALWRGAYSLHEVEVVKIDQEVPVPFFRADTIDLSVDWGALFRGSIVTEMEFYSPSLHFVDGGDEDSQDGSGTDWRQALQELTPVRINELIVYNGELNFHNFSSSPEVNIAMTDVDAIFTNLSNVARRDTAIYAQCSLTARMLETAEVSLSGNLDPLGDFRDFIIAMQIHSIDLTQLNDLTQAYANIDFESGDGDFVLELEADGGSLRGYARPLLNNVVILDLESDSEKGLLNVAWEAVVAALGQIFRNHPADRIAADIDIRGDLDNSEVSTWQAFRSIMRNAFIEAYEAQFRPLAP